MVEWTELVEGHQQAIGMLPQHNNNSNDNNMQNSNSSNSNNRNNNSNNKNDAVLRL